MSEESNESREVRPPSEEPAEEHSSDERDHSLDELAKGLANGSLSRRNALKWAGAAIVGGLLGSIPGVAWADHKPGHADPPGEGHKKRRTTTTTTTTVAPTTTTTTTVAPTTTTTTSTTTTISPNPECAGATCETFIQCSSGNPDCICTTLATGGGLCVPGSTSCDIVGPCGPNFECPEGSVCVVNTCCAGPVCAPLSLECELDAPASAARVTPASTGNGPTFGSR
jgi:hypothetical protein